LPQFGAACVILISVLYLDQYNACSFVFHFSAVSSGVVAHAWAVQCRPSTRFRTLAQRKAQHKAVVAVTRELAGFVWGLMTDRIKSTGMQKRAGDKSGEILGSFYALSHARL
jgi:hypothetical protein